MITIRQANIDDCATIQSVANIAFPATYAEILTEGQLKYMMEWMYSTESLRRQMQEEGHIYYIAHDEADRAVGYVSIQPEGQICFTCKKSMSCRNDKENTSASLCSDTQ